MLSGCRIVRVNPRAFRRRGSVKTNETRVRPNPCPGGTRRHAMVLDTTASMAE